MLDPQAQALLDLMAQRQVPPTHTLTPAEARQVYRDRRFYTQPQPPAVGEVRELRLAGPAGDIPARLYRPAGVPAAAVLPALVYFHGGGWVIGDLDTHDTLCRTLCAGAGCAVIAVDYRLSPEHRFPAAVQDAEAAVRAVFERADEWRLDRARIAVGGDSAGGNLAAVVSLLLRDAAARDAQGDADAMTPRPCFQLLIYPATDMRCQAPSHDRNGQGYLLTRDTIAYFTGHYADAAQHTDWRASPLLAAHHRDLPPALVLTAGYDPLRDEGLAYANALSGAGVACQYVCFERQIHGFITMGRVLDEANLAVDLCVAALRRAQA